jgi:hypothetical protein
MPDKKTTPPKVPIMEHLNIGEFNRGQSSRLIRNLVENDKIGLVLRNGKPLAVVIPYEQYLLKYAGKEEK